MTKTTSTRPPSNDMWDIAFEQGMFLTMAFIGWIEPPIDAYGAHADDYADFTADEQDEEDAYQREEAERQYQYEQYYGAY